MKIYVGGGETRTIRATDLMTVAEIGAKIDAERKALNRSYGELKTAVIGIFKPTERTRELEDGAKLTLTAPTSQVIDGDVLREWLLDAVEAKAITRAQLNAVAPQIKVVAVDSRELKKLADLGIPEVEEAVREATSTVPARSRTLTITPAPEADELAKAA